jgi:hypothetical protein
MLLCASALASADEGVNQAEYNRLQQELEKLASRNAWAGVERTYNAMLATGARLGHDDHVSGAHSARALGDITAARNRLMAANEISEDREVLDWLWEIDASYGKVFVAADKGSKKIDLRCSNMPFNPDQRKAVEFAQALVIEGGVFDGYLPQGHYTFGNHHKPEGIYQLDVVPRVQSVRIDTRRSGPGGMSDKDLRAIEKQQKKLKKQKKQEGKEASAGG